MKLYGKSGALKYNTDCAPNNGYFLIPLYDKVSEELQPVYTFVLEDSPSMHDGLSATSNIFSTILLY